MLWQLLCLLLVQGAAALVPQRYASASVRNTTSYPSYQIQTFQQRVDHFNESNTDLFTQRYAVIDDYHVPGGPVFFYLAGEAEMEVFFGEVYAIIWAEVFNAAVVMLEHRFYGPSQPTGDLSTDSLRLLTSEQALADAAYFLKAYNVTMQNSGKEPGQWLVMGCSYSGALSAWFREKYPDLVVASYAPSSPVEARTDFVGFYQQFAESAPTPECVQATQKASASITQLLGTAAGRTSLSNTFHTCEPITEQSAPFFLYCIVGFLGAIDQEDNPPDFPLNATCKHMTSGSDPVASWADMYIAQGGGGIQGCYGFNGECNSFDEAAFVGSLRLTQADSPQSADRAWFWQSCREFGYFATSRNGSSVFPDVSLQLQLDWCDKVFGLTNNTPNTTFTNEHYGGQTGLQATKVFVTNGLKDPWHRLSITKDLPGVQTALYEAGHCAPFHEPTNSDPASLKQARFQVESFIQMALSH